MTSIVVSVVGIGAPVLAAIFGISAAIAAQWSFQKTSEATPPDSPYPQNPFYADDIAVEMRRSGAREGFRHEAAAFQSAATFLAAGAAIEATAAAQQGVPAAILFLLGITLAIAPPIWFWTRASVAAQRAQDKAILAVFQRKYKILFTTSALRAQGYAAFIEEEPDVARRLNIAVPPGTEAPQSVEPIVAPLLEPPDVGD